MLVRLKIQCRLKYTHEELAMVRSKWLKKTKTDFPLIYNISGYKGV